MCKGAKVGRTPSSARDSLVALLQPLATFERDGTLVKIRGDRPGGLSYDGVVPAQDMIRRVVAGRQKLHLRGDGAAEVRQLAVHQAQAGRGAQREDGVAADAQAGEARAGDLREGGQIVRLEKGLHAAPLDSGR